MKQILEEILKKIKPSSKEKKELLSFADLVVSKLKEHGYKAEVEGSLAKDTWLSGDHDIDVFLFFSKDTPWNELEKKGLEIGKKILKQLGGKPEIAYAEHPYARAKINDIHLDIVPCYALESTQNLQSSVDRTPFHTRFVQANITEKQKDEVRLLKRFTKGTGVYSAKEKVRGFSGYLCELLVLKYGTFLETLKAARNWNYGVVIDIENYYKNKNDALQKFRTSLVAIDPIDEERNVAAALDENNFENFVYASKEFLKKPSIKFFFPARITPFSNAELKKQLSKHGNLLILKFKTPVLVEDVLYSQLKKSIKMLEKVFAREEFDLIESSIFSNSNSYFLFEFETTSLPKTKKLLGPPIKISKTHQEIFVRKYEKFRPWVENGKWFVKIPRKFVNAEQLLKFVLKNPKKFGIGRFVIEELKKGCRIFNEKNIAKEYKGEFAQFLTEYLVKKKSWEW